MNNHIPSSRQRGVALIVSLIMLLAITLMVVSASNLVQSNLKVVQNMESRDMVRFAAYAALEEAISSGRFTASPESVFDQSCEVPNQKCYDFNGDGTNDFFEIFGPLQPFSLIVTDRWGKIVYQTDNYQNNWDGTSRGMALPAGVYSYRILYSKLKGGPKNYELFGTVSILR